MLFLESCDTGEEIKIIRSVSGFTLYDQKTKLGAVLRFYLNILDNVRPSKELNKMVIHLFATLHPSFKLLNQFCDF